MRFLIALALVVLATPAFAQAQYADGTGTFVALHDLSFSMIGQRGVDATVGYRFQNGVDAGVRLGRQSIFGIGETVAGPVVGYTRPVGNGLTGRVEGALLYSNASGSQAASLDDDGFSVGVQALSQDIAATVSRSVRIVGSFRARPTVGAYASASQIVSARGADAGSYDRTDESAGLHVELPLTFRVLGRDAAIAPVGRIALAGTMSDPGYAYGGGGFRLNL